MEFPLTPNWTKVNFSTTIPADIIALGIEMTMNSEGVRYFDDINLTIS